MIRFYLSFFEFLLFIDRCSYKILTLPRPDPGRREKINLNFYFQALKAFMKPFETPQRNVKIKI